MQLMLRLLVITLASSTTAGQNVDMDLSSPAIQSYKPQTDTGLPEASVCAPTPDDLLIAVRRTMVESRFTQEGDIHSWKFSRVYKERGVKGFLTNSRMVVSFDRLHLSSGTKLVASVNSEMWSNVSGALVSSQRVSTGPLLYLMQQYLDALATVLPCS